MGTLAKALSNKEYKAWTGFLFLPGKNLKLGIGIPKPATEPKNHNLSCL